MTSAPWLVLMFSAGFGVFEQLKSVSLQTTLQRSVSVHLLPKVYAAQSAMVSLVFGLSTLLFGFITDEYGVRATYIIAAALLFVSGCYAAIIRTRWPEAGQNAAQGKDARFNRCSYKDELNRAESIVRHI